MAEKPIKEQRLRLVSELVSNVPSRRKGLYRCTCGNVKQLRMDHVSSNATVSCGCYRDEVVRTVNTTHGYTRLTSNRVEWNAYKNAWNRCNNPKTDRYPIYGGRGIEFRFKSFTEFITCIGPKPSPELSVDRINVNGHYECGNIRWANAETQARNKRSSYV